MVLDDLCTDVFFTGRTIEFEMLAHREQDHRLLIGDQTFFVALHAVRRQLNPRHLR